MGLNLSTIIRDTACRDPDEKALFAQGRILSRGELDECARRFAAGLSSLGVRRGQHVALMLPNIPEFTLSYFGSHYLGTPVVPLNVLLTAEEIAVITGAPFLGVESMILLGFEEHELPARSALRKVGVLIRRLEEAT